MRQQLSFISIAYFLCRAFFIGAMFSLFVKHSKQDAWLSFLIAFFIGFTIVLLIEYIASYHPEASLKEKYVLLFPKINLLLRIITALVFLFLATISFWNLSNLITSQFLNKTPKFVIAISFFIPLLLLLNKEPKIIARVSLILFYISIILFIISFIGLIFQFRFDNFTPMMQNSLEKPIIPFLGFQVFPLFLLLLFPQPEMIPSLKKGYILSSITSWIMIVTIIGVLGVELSLIYQYPEFHILKRAYQGVLTYRMENMLSIQFLFDIFVFATVSLKGCNELVGWNKGIVSYILPAIMLISSIYIFKDNTIANSILEHYISWIIPLILTMILLLLWVKTFYKKRRKLSS